MTKERMEFINKIWAISLFVIGVSTIFLIGIKLIGSGQQNVAVRFLGVIDLVALPIFTFATIRKMETKH